MFLPTLTHAGASFHAWLPSLIGPLNATLIGRMLLTLLLCGAVGLERSTHERSSGFRTHILVGLGACLMTLTGGYGFHELHSSGGDPLRVASYVVSGIGFLGAGAILRHGTTVRGLNTAASLWGAAGIGIAVAVGLAGLAIVTAVLVLFTLGPLERMEKRLHIGTAPQTLTIHLANESGVAKAMVALGKLRLPVKRTSLIPGAGTSATLRTELNAALRPDEIAILEERLMALKDVERVDTAHLKIETREDAPRVIHYGARRIRLKTMQNETEAISHESH